MRGIGRKSQEGYMKLWIICKLLQKLPLVDFLVYKKI